MQCEKKIIQEYHGELRFEDLAGRKNWINYLEYAFDPEENGLLFIGEPHLGKKTMIRAAAGEWVSQGYETKKNSEDNWRVSTTKLQQIKKSCCFIRWIR